MRPRDATPRPKASVRSAVGRVLRKPSRSTSRGHSTFSRWSEVKPSTRLELAR